MMTRVWKYSDVTAMIEHDDAIIKALTNYLLNVWIHKIVWQLCAYEAYLKLVSKQKQETESDSEGKRKMGSGS